MKISYQAKTAAKCHLALTALLLCRGVAIAADTKQDRPNIVFILGDDIGVETLGCYGGTTYPTPHLDYLAANGIRFDHCYSMPVCHPTRVCLLTGRYPFRLGHPRWGSFPRNEERNTFSHLLRQAGYATAVAGKWQLTLLRDEPDHPHRLGFDEYCLFGWHEGPRYYQPLIWQNGSIRSDVRDRYGPDVYCQFVIDFITRHANRPFMVFYSMALCHDVTDDLDQPVPHGPYGRYDTYEEMVERMDERVGRLVTALDRLRLRENTLIVFTGDNGTPKRYITRAVNGRLIREPIISRLGNTEVRGGKGDLTDAGTRVPTIASWPGTISAGQVVNDLIDFSDVLPTFVELAGATIPAELEVDGRSFAWRLLGRKRPGRTWAYSESGGLHWVRTQRWKLYNDGRLYDVKLDPLEQRALDRARLGSRESADLVRLQAALDGLSRRESP